MGSILSDRTGEGSGSSETIKLPPECPDCKDEEGRIVKHKYIDRYPEDEAYCRLYFERTGQERMVEVFEPCHCAAEKNVKRLFKSSEITPAMRERTFESFKLGGKPQIIADMYHVAHEYFDAFQDIRDKQENGIALLGNPGSGKTHLLMAIANRLIQAGIPVLYFPFGEGMEELKNLMNNKEAYSDFQQRLYRASVLFIDDLFKTKKGDAPTPHEIKFMFAVINYRYLNRLPVLISSELTINRLVGLDEAIGSRICEMTSDYQINIIGQSLQLNHRIRGVVS